MSLYAFYFLGQHPVGAVGLVEAEDFPQAKVVAENKLIEIGFPQQLDLSCFIPLKLADGESHILLDGDY